MVVEFVIVVSNMADVNMVKLEDFGCRLLLKLILSFGSWRQKV